MTSPRNLLAIFAIASMLLVAGCGSGNDSTSGGGYGGTESETGGAYGGGATTKTSAETSPSEGVATIAVAAVPKLGKVIVDSDGFTLYDFHKDKGTTSSCYGACAGVWPPLTTGSAPKAAGGVSASKLGTTKRKDGTTQVTFAGHPLYTYTADTKPGDAKGNDITTYGGEWYALTPSGEEP
jgi:predicted lipoprotein with Yx(FWY)xxD motif